MSQIGQVKKLPTLLISLSTSLKLSSGFLFLVENTCNMLAFPISRKITFIDTENQKFKTVKMATQQLNDISNKCSDFQLKILKSSS